MGSERKMRQSRLEITKEALCMSHKQNYGCESIRCVPLNTHRKHASDAQMASERESCPASRANQRNCQRIHGEHDPTIRAEIAASGAPTKVAAQQP